jgi:hypothetical protein
MRSNSPSTFEDTKDIFNNMSHTLPGYMLFPVNTSATVLFVVPIQPLSFYAANILAVIRTLYVLLYIESIIRISSSSSLSAVSARIFHIPLSYLRILAVHR